MSEDAVEAANPGAALRRWRERQGWTLEEVSDLAGLSKSYLSRIEGGFRVPPPASKVLMARKLGASVGELFPATGAEGAEDDGASGTDWPFSLFCVVCWLTDPTGADPAVMVINGLSVCYIHASCMQGGELAAVLRLIQERKRAAT